MDASRILDAIIRSNYRMALLNSSESDRLVALFKRLTLTTGRAIYHWRPNMGLSRLGVEHILIPRTRTPGEVLSYIGASRHFGVYLLQDFGSALQRTTVRRELHRIDEANDGVDRLVLFLDTQLTIPDDLRGRVANIRHNVRPRQRQATG